MRGVLLSLFAFGAAGCSLLPAAPTPSAAGATPVLVDASKGLAGLRVDMRYAGAENFIGRPIAGYEAPVCLLTPGAAAGLAQALARLKPFGLGLKVYDCYRPQRAVDDFMTWARDRNDQARKSVHYPAVDKADLCALGYIAERSGHSRGSTVDLTLVDLGSDAEIDMGSGYDLFDPLSWPSSAAPAPQARAARLALQAVMLASGFRPLQEEWWHFTLVDEPYPDTYFDLPVR